MKPLFQKEFPTGVFEFYSQEPPMKLIHVHQTHSDKIINYLGNSLSQCEADGIMLDFQKYPNITLAIKTADCLPILLLGDKITMVHAGWKGLQNNILAHKNLQLENIHTAFIGPSIHRFEVTADFKKEFPANPHFYQVKDQLYFDLQKEAQCQLSKYFPAAKVYNSNICTLENPAYNSYRNNKTLMRNWNIFKIMRSP